MTIEIIDEMVTKIHAKIYGNCCPPGCNCDGNQWERREVKHFLTAALPIIEQAVRKDERERCEYEIRDYWEAYGELIDTHNGARLAFDAVAARIAEGSGE